MDCIPPELAAEIAERYMSAAADHQASRVIDAIKSVPDCTVSPSMIAQIATALAALCEHLPHDAQEVAQGYLDDLHDDMKGFA